MQFDAKTDVTGHVTAPRCRLGSPTCNFEITYKDNDPSKSLEMYVTLPNTYKGKLVTQTYRMRSIIEAIQEINRRTATFNCNVSFEYAKDIFDANLEDTYNQFACNDHEDGLPAASNASINDLTDLFKIQIVQDEDKLWTTDNMYPLKDILNGWEHMIRNYTTFDEFINNIDNLIDLDYLAEPSMDQVHADTGVVVVPYTPPPMVDTVSGWCSTRCMQNNMERGIERMFALIDGKLIQYNPSAPSKSYIIYDTENTDYDMFLINETYMLFFVRKKSFNEYPIIINNRKTGQTATYNIIGDNVQIQQIDGIMRLLDNNYYIMNALTSTNETVIALMDAHSPNRIIRLPAYSGRTCFHAGCILHESVLEVIYSVNGSITHQYASNETPTDSGLHRVSIDIKTFTIIQPNDQYNEYYNVLMYHIVDEYTSQNGKRLTIEKAIFRQLHNGRLLMIAYFRMPGTTWAILLPVVLKASNINNLLFHDSKEHRDDITTIIEIPSEYTVTKVNYTFMQSGSMFSDTHSDLIAELDRNNFYFTLHYSTSSVVIVHGTIDDNDNVSLMLYSQKDKSWPQMSPSDYPVLNNDYQLILCIDNTLYIGYHNIVSPRQISTWSITVDAENYGRYEYNGDLTASEMQNYPYYIHKYGDNIFIGVGRSSAAPQDSLPIIDSNSLNPANVN